MKFEINQGYTTIHGQPIIMLRNVAELGVTEKTDSYGVNGRC
jgi:hypothetical protein